MSFSAAAIAIAVAGSIAAVPVSGSAAAAKGASKPSHGKKNDPPKLSKWEQHVQAMLKVSAPGDEYFGRMKMSYLGINNTFRDDLIRAGAYTTDPHVISGIQWADEALNAWAKKYPNDPQLARSYFLAFQMYRKIWVQEYQQKAWDYAHIVIKKWPNTFFGKTLKKDLQIGYTEHFFASPVPCSAVSPSPSPAANATALPSPAPSPTPDANEPKTDVLPVPCLTPTPSPTPMPTGSLTPAPSGSLTPSPSGSVSPSPTPTPTPTPTPHR